MRRGRRKKIEVPTDTQPQFELGDTAEDIERRRREGERGEREERTGREGQREDGERGGKRARKEEIRECELTQTLM